ncbi:MAG TPA: STAS domain-containing protein [Anaerolineae bacterium]|nr:STAS domain-containing protein [Anaerolineae bacterium]
MEFKIQETEAAGTGRVVAVTGQLDAVTAPELKARLKNAVAGGHRRIIVDLSQVSFIDSSGLAALVSGLKTAREAGGSLSLVGVNERTRMAFRLSMLDRVFEIDQGETPA